QVHEEVVQLSRQEQRELKRQQKRQQQQDQQHQNNDVQHTENAVPRRDRNNQQRPNRPNRHRDPSVLNENQNTPVVIDEKQIKVDVIDAPKHDVMNTALIINVDQGQSEIVALTPEHRHVERVETTSTEVA
ncbi:ribonuclease E/G, partial [Acinetobacter baumannii]